MPLFDDKDRLRDFIFDDRFPIDAFELVLRKLADDQSESSVELSRALTSRRHDQDTDDGLTPGVSSTVIRERILECATKYPNVRESMESVVAQILGEISPDLIVDTVAIGGNPTAKAERFDDEICGVIARLLESPMSGRET